jgi:hypothetical protein
MSLCALKLNKDIYGKSEHAQSDIFHSKHGYSIPHYVKQHRSKDSNIKEKRFLLTSNGDPISKMELEMKEFEQNKIKEQKKFYVEV